MTDSYFSLPKVSGKYRLNVDLSKTNWFGVGGRVKVVFFPKDISDLQFFLQNKSEDLRVIILGVGSNIIVKDGEIDACVIKLNFGFTDISHQNNILDIREALEKAIYHIERNGNAKIIFTDVSIQLTRLIHRNRS